MDEKKEKRYYVYLLRCSDGTLYCGYTDDVEKRVKAHNDGKGAKYTRTRRPVALVYHETCEQKGEALKREWAIKKLTRQEKLQLIASAAEKEEKK